MRTSATLSQQSMYTKRNMWATVKNLHRTIDGDMVVLEGYILGGTPVLVRDLEQFVTPFGHAYC